MVTIIHLVKNFIIVVIINSHLKIHQDKETSTLMTKI